MTLLRRAVFPLALAAVVLAHLLVAVPSLVELRLWEDEAFNLTVPLNLLRGLGYTSDGTLSGSQLTPFDPRISTGPVVLLPVAAALATGADMVLAGRSVILLFFAALLVGLWLVGSRIGGKWAGLAAVAVPLGLDANASPSPLQGPADILGEIPAAALLVFALAVLRSRPWLAGLFLGLAVQSKTIALLAAPALVLAVFLSEPGQTVRQRLRRLLPFVGMAAVPTALFALWQLIELGPAGFAVTTRHFVGFLLSGGQTGTWSPFEKLTALQSDWRLPLAVTALVALGALAHGLAAVMVLRRGGELPADVVARTPRRDLVVLLAASALGLLTWLGWWLASAHTPVWIRHPSPGLFAFVPVLAAFVVLALRVVARERQFRVRAVAIAGAAALTAVLAVQMAGHVGEVRSHTGETLTDQRRVAAEIAALRVDWLAGVWGGTVSVTVMSGAHAALVDAPDVADLPRIRHHAGLPCGSLLLAAGPYVVCEAP
ncbi:hypothetical protein SAMN05216282_10646 [Cryobacterium psychrotolerans]|uniref:Glycosyltransferase RgtA/B/C/D-like domain-containing protein n=1 Tax=Cryobacterium psychrotolerans TaxID=386301 RepID=A0A1G9BVR8_9MICO|nr:MULTISPECIES: hypothetical protein [Cryobacterium]TFD42935.1 hypothetical protein E3T33_11365 [Cryobacterium sp. TMT1-2-1]TFD84106.1 hypothetical protein E3T56_10350 [Cryobacterium psychrotolerans]SDK43507.1 hypothetical protein SAMN05216282_10646 [Cryobacterium psychrotolerans]